MEVILTKTTQITGFNNAGLNILTEDPLLWLDWEKPLPYFPHIVSQI